MTTRLTDLPFASVNEIDKEIHRRLTAAEGRKLLKNPKVFDLMIEAMRSHEAFRLIHSIYNPVEDVRAAADAKVRAAGFDPDKHEWIGDPNPPSFDEENEEVVVGLYDTLDTLEQTIEFYWPWMAEEHKNNSRWPEFKTDPKHLRDFRDPEHKQWRPRTRQWVKIDLSANRGKSPEWTRKNVDHTQIAGIEIKATMAQHPKAMASRDGSNKPWLNLTALDFNWGRFGQPWQNVPCVGFDRGGGEVGLSANWVGSKDDDWSCPVLLRE